MILVFAFWFLLRFHSDVESSTAAYDFGLIMGGEPADIRDFPYQLSLEGDNVTHYFFFCGGSIIHDSWAITAAHCVYDLPEYMKLYLRSGSSYLMTGGTVYDVAKVIIHPNYKPEPTLTPFDYDVSILKVSTPFHYSDVSQKILMASETPSPGSRAVVSGWGSLNYKEQLPDQLQKLDVYIMEYEECKRSIHSSFILSPRLLCAHVPGGGKNPYLGDSGGPLVADNLLVGVVSFGIDQDFEKHPGFYTNVAYIRNWVTSTIEQESRYR